MKILFIGGTGNISEDCAALLHRQGNEIWVLTRGRKPVPPQYRAVAADRTDPAAFRNAVKELKPDAVINFLGYELKDVQTDFEALSGRVGQYIFISSASVYRKPAKQLPITEDAPVGNPWWEYARKKIACEEWLREQKGFPVTIVRPSHTYSKHWVPNVVSSSSYTVARRLEVGRPVYVPDDGENPWTLTATADFAVGLAGLVGNTRAVGETFHITSDEALTWNQIYQEIAKAVGAPAPQILPIPTDFICRVAPQYTGTLKGDKAHPGVFDNAKIKRFVPGFRSRIPFREGVRQSVAWLRAHPEEQNLKPEIEQSIEAVIGAWVQGTGENVAGQSGETK